MKLVIIFFLFLAISYYIFLQRKKIVEGHDTIAANSAAKATELNYATNEINSTEVEIDKLLVEVNELIEKEKSLNEAIEEMGKEGGETETDGEGKICDMTDCETKNVKRKCTEFKKAAGVKCID